MTTTDPIADILMCLCNAARMYHETVSILYLKLKNVITSIPVEEGYIASTPIEGARIGKTLMINLKYGAHHEAAIQGLKCVSKPGLRMYAKSTNLSEARGGLGVAILSMSSDLLADRQVTEEGIGGEVLAYVWR